MRLSSNWSLAALSLMAAVMLTVKSVDIERTGPEQAAYGNMCGPAHDAPCYEPVLNAGFPVGYLFDNPGISVERQLALIEDEFRIGAFLLDVAIYFALVLPAALAVRAAWTAWVDRRRRPA